jgi:D-beta-D-heptose 7-phosphate kinase/D-beta-D-heptose 1-phosphate adenosyltransferase
MTDGLPMALALPDLIDRIAGRRITVVGDAMLDTYLGGAAERLSREAPVPIVSVERREYAPGGAGNTAANVVSLGGTARLVTVVGDDDEGRILTAELERRGVDTRGVVEARGRRTLSKTRVTGLDHMFVRFDDGSTEPVDGVTRSRLVNALRAAAVDSDAILISDYGYGVLSPAVLAALMEIRAADRAIVVVDAKDARRYRDLRPTAVKPNYDEAIRLLGESRATDRRRRALQITSGADKLLEATGSDVVAVTLDTEGALVIERGRAPHRTYAHPAVHSRAAGAGDTFVGALTLALAAKAPTAHAAELASAAAAVVVGKPGTAECTATELREILSSGQKLLDTARVVNRLDYYRKQGSRIVFTNGCFDILHSGHITYLDRAKALGDVLVVGLNSDASVRRLKGDGRPINRLEDRAAVLAALSSVDHIVAFDEDSPVELIRLIRPHAFAKGGDYSRDTLPEAELVESLGGEVQILPLVEDRSTTRVIEQVNRSYGNGVAGAARR